MVRQQGKYLDNGQKMALDVLEASGEGLHRLLTQLTLRKDAAEELLQELFIRLSASPAFVRADDPTAYAFRSAANIAFEWRRKNRQTAQLDESLLPPEAAGQMDMAIENESLAQVLDAIGHLNETMRFLVISHYIEQQSYDQIAAKTGKSPKYVRAMCSKAVTKIRKMVL
jgi:RNA polymerase sigma factor (sigma-70 family)